MVVKVESEQAWLFLREFTKEILLTVKSTLPAEKITPRNITPKIVVLDKNISKPKLSTQKSKTPVENVSLSLNLGNVNDLLDEEGVYGVECPGPGKFLVKRVIGKGSQVTPVSLNEVEIKEIIRVFSQSAKVYPSEDVFNVTFKNLSLTAFISDFVGSRFVITKYLNPELLV